LPRALTNANGLLVWNTFAKPYGDIAEKQTIDPLSGRVVVTNLRLPGQYDERLFQQAGINMQGPYYNWNRWYLPSLGRYLELDPLALEGNINGEYAPDWYNYSLDNPLRYSDASGLFVGGDDLCIGIGAGAVYVAGLLYELYKQGQCGKHPEKCGGPPTAARWQCSASCNVQPIPGRAPPTFPDRVSGTGSGSSEDDACREAKRDATQSAPPGTYPRHCQCRCNKG